jgi:hypothetical protein
VVVTSWRLADGHLLVLDDLQEVRDGLPKGVVRWADEGRRKDESRRQ